MHKKQDRKWSFKNTVCDLNRGHSLSHGGTGKVMKLIQDDFELQPWVFMLAFPQHVNVFDEWGTEQTVADRQMMMKIIHLHATVTGNDKDVYRFCKCSQGRCDNISDCKIYSAPPDLNSAQFSLFIWYKITTAAASRHFMLQDPTILKKPQQALSDSRKEKLWRPETQTKTCKLDTETGGGYRRHTWPPWSRANSAALLLFFCDTYTQKEQKTFKKDNLLQTLHSMFVRNQRAHPLCLGLTLICWVCAGNLYGSTLIYIHEEIFS